MTLKNENVCLMSIRPKFFDRIVERQKLVEYRKVSPKNQGYIFLYVSSPIKKICGIIEIEEVLTDDVDLIWESTKNYSGISKAEFYSYVGLNKKISALFIKSYIPIVPITPNDIIENFIAPQNYKFIKNEKLSTMV